MAYLSITGGNSLREALCVQCLLRIVLHDEVTEPTNAHVDVQIQMRSLRGVCEDFPKAVLKLKTKVTGAENQKFKVFLLPRLEMRVFQGFPEAASKIIQTTTETTILKEAIAISE